MEEDTEFTKENSLTLRIKYDSPEYSLQNNNL